MTTRAPFGRIGEAIDKLTDDQKPRAATKEPLRFGGATELKVWSNRAMMAKAVRQQEKAGTRPRWMPVVKLGETEGYC